MTSASAKVTAHFPVRRMDFSFTDTDKYWWNGNPFMTHFMNNLSSLFPYGEKFFVDSVRAVREQITDAQLQKDISAFIGQEAMHSKVHATYNEYAQAHNIDLHTLELRIKYLMEFVTRFSTKKMNLAVTCALEHFTATMAEQLLKREDISLQMQDPRMYRLWLWHAIEENEHKSVAYDAYQAIGGGYFTRVLSMAFTSLTFVGVIAWFQLGLLRRDGQLTNWRSWRYGLTTLFGRHGYVRGLLKPYLEYYKPGFHPAQQDTRDLENHWRRRLGFSLPSAA